MNAAKFTLERLEDQCKTELRSMTETSDSPVLRHPPFQSTPTTPDTSHSGKKVKFIDRDPHYYTRRVKEAIHIRLHPDNINRDFGIEIPEAWMPTIKKSQQQESRATADRRGSKSLSETARIEMHQSELLNTNQPQQSIMLYKITHDQSTPSPEED